MLEKLVQTYETHYKKFMVVTFLMLFFFIGVLGYSKITTGEFVQKDVSLEGGVLITIKTDKALDVNSVEAEMEKELGTSVDVKSLRSFGSNRVIGYTVELESGTEIEQAKSVIEKVTNLDLEEGGYTTEDVSSRLGETFFQSMVKALVAAFVVMSIVVFIYFRIPIPSMAVVTAALSDLLGTLAVMNILGMELSTGGIAALLMLIGYSVDTDILLSARVLKRDDGDVKDRIRNSVKTGLTMQLATIAALSALLVLSQATILKQIASILIIGLMLDIVNTWIQNTGILRWYVELKEKSND